MEENVAETETKTMKVEALGTRILVRLDNPEEITDGGIIIPDGAQEMPIEGKIFGVGADCLTLKVGDKVLVPPHAGSFVNLRGNGFTVMDEEEVMVRIHDVD
jgi:chaperonin GroES|tara:strand:+ start:6297 stop:6602 length:306 start_codon:yes stop_codon:yes gene_type:complete